MPETQQECWHSASSTPTSECKAVSGRQCEAAADHSYLHNNHGGAFITQVQFGAIHTYICGLILIATMSTDTVLT